MSKLLKDRYSLAFFEDLSIALKLALPKFDATTFTNQIFDKKWGQKELKERMYHIADVLQAHLSLDYSTACQEIIKTLTQLDTSVDTFLYMFFPHFLQEHGLNHFGTSLQTMEKVTQSTSCEFAIRPFIIQDTERAIEQLLQWTHHKSHHVRRLASEGCRPRLPWAMALPAFKKDPSPMLPILENLKNDPSEYVRRSVANNLNDISKDHPDLVLEIASRWKDHSDGTNWIIKHACRTLLKQGHPKAMGLFGFMASDKIAVTHFKLPVTSIQIGASLPFQFNIQNKNKQATKIRLEYSIYFLKANGTHSKKVFKISEKVYAPNSKTTIEKSQLFKNLSTRKLYPGKHMIGIVVNGIEYGQKTFEIHD